MTESAPTTPPPTTSPESSAHDDFSAAAQRILSELTADPDAQLRDAQLASRRDLGEFQRRVRVVQRPGWRKSAVSSVATRLLRAAGTGASRSISPLLALLRDQIAAARRAGVRAA